MNIFENNKINLKNLKMVKDTLIKVSNALFVLSKSSVFNNRLAIGGAYHKNYYNYICSGFFNNYNKVFIQKNAPISEFLYNIKQNMCNYGIYFIKDKNDFYIEIYSGNSFLIEKTQQNFIESFINKNKCFINKRIRFENLENFYEKNYLNKLKSFNIQIKSKNKNIQNQIKKFELSGVSNYKIVIEKNLNYKILNKINLYEISKENIFKNFKIQKNSDGEIIELINLTNQKKVVNNKFLLYNELTNNFDIYKTLKYLSWRLANDKNYTKLAKSFKRRV